MNRVRLLPLLIAVVLAACSGSEPPSAAPSAPRPALRPPPSQPASQPPRVSPSEPLFKGDAAYITEMNAIIDEIATPLTDEELKQFSIAGVLPSSARFVLLGEHHINFNGIMLEARALQRFATSKDTILFEAPLERVDCPSIVRNLYFVRRYNERFSDYDVGRAQALQMELLKPFERLYRQLHLAKLSFRDATCMGWDHPRRTPIRDFDVLSNRNATMVKRVNTRANTTNSKIFVIAGAFHLPTGDLDEFRDNALAGNLRGHFTFSAGQLEALRPPSYYKMLKDSTDKSKRNAIEVQNAQHVIKTAGFGSTEVIFDYFKGKNFSELIPADLLAATQPCGPACD